MIESEGEGIRSGGKAGNEGVWCTTGPVPEIICSLFEISTSMPPAPKGEGFFWLLSRRCQMNTPRRIRKMLRAAQAAIPPIAPALNLQGRNLGQAPALGRWIVPLR